MNDKWLKLPKWAQDELNQLERNLRKARQERDEALKAPPSNTAVQRTAGILGDGPREVFLPDCAIVRFYLEESDDRLRSGIEVHVSKDEAGRRFIRVATWNGRINIIPTASNCFEVTEERR